MTIDEPDHAVILSFKGADNLVDDNSESVFFEGVLGSHENKSQVTVVTSQIIAKT